ncbi:hypothetical protein LEP1GSC086_1943 [Leptospira weilii str. LNT 1234]|nr:hypothetical protein LEP1GSC086_1943 [Leptospira weilii str. LNT 1234]
MKWTFEAVLLIESRNFSTTLIFALHKNSLFILHSQPLFTRISKPRNFCKSCLKIQFEYFFPKICLTLFRKFQYFLL